MSFSFGFSGDDIDDDVEGEDQDALAKEMSTHTISDGEHLSVPVFQPKRHSLEELVSFYSSLIVDLENKSSIPVFIRPASCVLLHVFFLTAL
jgi:hypothetical protein